MADAALPQVLEPVRVAVPCGQPYFTNDLDAHSSVEVHVATEIPEIPLVRELNAASHPQVLSDERSHAVFSGWGEGGIC